MLLCCERVVAPLLRHAGRRGWHATAVDPFAAPTLGVLLLGMVAVTALWARRRWAPVAVVAWHGSFCLICALAFYVAASRAAAARGEPPPALVGSWEEVFAVGAIAFWALCWAHVLWTLARAGIGRERVPPPGPSVIRTVSRGDLRAHSLVRRKSDSPPPTPP